MQYPDNFLSYYNTVLADAGLDLRQMFQDLLQYEASLGFMPYTKLPDALAAQFDKLASLPGFDLLKIQHSCFEDWCLTILR